MLKFKYLTILSIFVFSIISCKNDTDTNKSAIQQKPFRELRYDYLNLPLTISGYKGKIEYGLHWEDNNGDNYFILTTEDKIIKEDNEGYPLEIFRWHGYHYASKGSNDYHIIREFVDYINKCEYDLGMGFIKDAFRIKDLNKNNYAEIFVLYKYICCSDDSPMNMKLLVFENGEKFSIKGIAKNSDNRIDEYSGKMHINKNFDKADTIIKKTAIELFKRNMEYNEEYYWR